MATGGDGTVESVFDLTKRCIARFEQLIATHGEAIGPAATSGASGRGAGRREHAPLENRLADFNLWADNVGAMALREASLDSRFRDRPGDLELVKGILAMLLDFLGDYHGTSSGQDEALRNVDSSLNNLAMIGVAIRRTGRASRHRREDKTFDSGEHQDLERHLTCVVLLQAGEALSRDGHEGSGVDTLITHCTDRSRLSNMQRRLIEATLRRRHRFTLARQRQQASLQAAAAPEQDSQPAPQTHARDAVVRGLVQDAGASADDRLSHDKRGKLPGIRGGASRASTATGTLDYSPDPARPKPAADTRTQITSIVADVEFPEPPMSSRVSGRRLAKCPCCWQSFPQQEFTDPERWRQHLVEDLCPYTCLADQCPTPQLIFASRKEWESHVRRSHPTEWRCPLCDEREAYVTMEGIANHFQVHHAAELPGHDLQTFMRWSATQPLGITACPLCSSTGAEDAPELVDHVLRHSYDFALRALPWNQSVAQLTSRPIGTFATATPDGDFEQLQMWIETTSPDEPRQLQLSVQERAASYPGPNAEAEGAAEDLFFFAQDDYFWDGSAANSARPQGVGTQASTAQEPPDSAGAGFSVQPRTLTGHSQKVVSVCFSPDGRSLASASYDKTIMLWDLATNTSTATLANHTGDVNSVAISPDGATLLSASEDETIQLWDLVTFKSLWQSKCHESAVWSASFSPHGGIIASGGRDGDVILWDAASGYRVQTANSHNGVVYSTVFSPDGSLLASCSEDTTIELLDTATCSTQYFLIGHTKKVWSIDFCPNSRRLVSTSADGTIKIWDVLTGQCTDTFAHLGRVFRAAAFSPDLKHIASGSYDSLVDLWDIETGSQVQSLAGHADGVVSVAWSPDGRSLASGSLDGTIRLWQRVGLTGTFS